MGFIMKYLIFVMITMILLFLPEYWLSKHYKIIFVLYMLVTGIIFLI